MKKQKKFGNMDFPALGEETIEIDYEQEYKDIMAFKEQEQKEDMFFDNITEI